MRKFLIIAVAGLLSLTIAARVSEAQFEAPDARDSQFQPAQAPSQPRPAPPGARPGAGPTTPPPGSPAPGTVVPRTTAPTAPPPSAAPTSPGSATSPSPFESAMAGATSAPTASSQPDTFGTLAGFSSGGLPQMIGDFGQLPLLRAAQAGTPGLPQPFPPPRPPGVPGRSVSTMVAPSIRTIKVSENQSPLPHDRVYYSFNYFDNVNDAVNDRLNAPVQDIQIFREIFGFEKTFNDGQGSIGLRVPLNTISAGSRGTSGLGGSSTAFGDLSIIGKYILTRNPETGSLISGGLSLTVPTGPGRFAGYNAFGPAPHTTTFQPFLGYLFNAGNLYLHGFTAIDVPCTSSDVTLIYNDIGLGYYLRRDAPDSGLDRLVTLIAPTFEVHINDPLNHRDAFNIQDPVGTPDVVDLTYGLNIGLRQNTFLTLGLVTPVTGPRPFELEALAFLNVFFGRSARRGPLAPPVLGGY